MQPSLRITRCRCCAAFVPPAHPRFPRRETHHLSHPNPNSKCSRTFPREHPTPRVTFATAFLRRPAKQHAGQRWSCRPDLRLSLAKIPALERGTHSSLYPLIPGREQAPTGLLLRHGHSTDAPWLAAAPWDTSWVTRGLCPVWTLSAGLPWMGIARAERLLGWDCRDSALYGKKGLGIKTQPSLL